MKKLRLVSPPAADPRGGTTLTEVLMSILCMGIGVVAVASLFPIALLRSVQATQLTSATILRFNAETLIDLNPAFIFDPDNDNNFVEHTDGTNADGDPYLIDPWGAMIVRTDAGRTISTRDNVGVMARFDGLAVFLDPNNTNASVPAFTTTEALGLVTLPDSWVTLYDDIVDPLDGGATDTNRLYVDLGNSTTFDFADISTQITTAQNAGLEVRAVLFSESGDTSETRSLSDTANTTPVDAANRRIQWLTALPNNGDYDSVSRIRVEVRENRFTWLLTVRDVKPEGANGFSALVDVVVFFNRSPSLDEETAYTLTQSGNTRTYTVNKVTATDPDAFLKKGGFMLDTRNGKWHRLGKVNDATDTITLERNVTTSLDTHEVCFMPGVVEVYELGRKTFP